MTVTPDQLLVHDSFVRGIARAILGEDAEVDDVVQETYLRALDARLRKPGSLRGWFRVVTRNIAFRVIRGRNRRRARERARAEPEAVQSTEHIVACEEIRHRLIRAMLHLPEEYRSVLALRFYDDLPPRTVASRLRMPVETVKTRVKRGVALLRERLEEQDPGDRQRWLGMLVVLADLRRPRSGFGLARLARTVGLLTGGMLVMVSLLSVDPTAVRKARTRNPLPKTVTDTRVLLSDLPSLSPVPLEQAAPEPLEAPALVRPVPVASQRPAPRVSTAVAARAGDRTGRGGALGARGAPGEAFGEEGDATIEVVLAGLSSHAPSAVLPADDPSAATGEIESSVATGEVEFVMNGEARIRLVVPGLGLVREPTPDSRTGEEGRVAMTLPVGVWEVASSEDGVYIEPTRFEVEAGRLVVVELRVSRQIAQFRLRPDDDWRPVADLLGGLLTLVPDSGHGKPVEAEVDEYGWASVRGFAPGTFGVYFEWPGEDLDAPVFLGTVEAIEESTVHMFLVPSVPR